MADVAMIPTCRVHQELNQFHLISFQHFVLRVTMQQNRPKKV